MKRRIVLELDHELIDFLADRPHLAAFPIDRLLGLARAAVTGPQPMSHPVYGDGTSALVYIGDEVSDRADGVPIGTVVLIGTGGAVQVMTPGGMVAIPVAALCLVRRADPPPPTEERAHA